MIKFLCYMLFYFPILVFIYFLFLLVQIIGYIVPFIIWIFRIIYWLIARIFGKKLNFPSFGVTNYRSYSYNINNNHKNKKVVVVDEESDFDIEADLWGLSKEDRRIAKQERMSPADFIEAEERDDDVLDTDEWE